MMVMPDVFKIPDEFLKKMNDDFLKRFIYELQETFGVDVLDRPAVTMLLGTFGWCEALKTSCEAFDMMWLYDYYRGLKRWDSDKFDDEFLTILKEKHGIERSEKPLSETKP